jgi:hypothetical protein
VNEPAHLPDRPVDHRDRRVYVWWGVGLGCLAALGLFCWLLLAPFLEARAVLGQCWDGKVPEKEVVPRLGGQAAAARKISLCLLLRGEGHTDNRFRAVGFLGQCGRWGVAPLIRALKDSRPNVRYAAADGLARIGPEANPAVDALASELADSDCGMEPPPAAMAAYALGRIGPAASSALPALRAAVLSPKHNVKCRAAWAVWRIGGKAEGLIEPLIQVVHLDYYNSRGLATQTLVEIGTPAVPALVDELANEDWHRRLAAAQVLGLMGPAAREAIPALERVVAMDKGDVVPEAAAGALKSIRSGETGK